GEVTPDTAHEIGMKLAQEMWGERFEVIVATHLDKKYIHNHFVLNSVSFRDGYKYYSNLENTDRFRIKSDRLCREYRLSVIENPQRGRRPSYAVYLAEEKGEPTYRSLVKADIDKAIAESLTDRQFFQNLKKMGYDVRVKQDISVRPQGRTHSLRLFKNFGEDYTMEAINRRILSHGMPPRKPPEPEPAKPKQIAFHGNFKTVKRITGFRALYIRYFYMLGGRPQYQMKSRPPTNKQILFIFRDDIRKMHELSNEMKLLGANRIDSAEQLSSYKEGMTAKIAELTDTRQHLRYKARSVKDEPTIAGLKAEIAGLSTQLGALRREVKLCSSIEARTADMKEKIRIAAEIRAKEQAQLKSKEMEEQTYAKRRRSR
ncbi:MAG: relaxase/mobilization nuclease domain-containing protein, partial [Oscillospiraceae bacterium]|nr:relaxase/mobilization nuclease domain-containing protein [Oscillospiraceae bacterium]